MFKRTLVAALGIALCLGSIATPSASGRPKIPRTGFEERNGESWTTHKEELAFLDEVDRGSAFADVEVIGKTSQGRPLHLVTLGHPGPRSPAEIRRQPTVLFVCSQHGNEPAGREACLQMLRNLAFTKLGAHLLYTNVLFVPTANPDGVEANTRENSRGVDLNRDHLNLTTPETQAVARVVRDYQPDVVLDLHEYGPSLPVVYDDEILLLWPRNLNVDEKIHDLSESLVLDHLAPAAEERGFSADEYGQYEIADQDIHQSAGDGDEGISRNTMGLRHSLGILVESAVSQDPRNGPQEVLSEAEVNLRRVASHVAVSMESLSFMRENGESVAREQTLAKKRKAIEGSKGNRPVYFGGGDNQEPEEGDVVDPPPCYYLLSEGELKEVKLTLSLLGIAYERIPDGYMVPMWQSSEPLIPLLLDGRGARHSVAAKPAKC